MGRSISRFSVIPGSGAGNADGVKGGWPAYDAVMMFKILVIQAQNNLSDERTEF